MTNEFKIISEDGLKTICKAIKKASTVGEILDDANSVTDKTYSSFEIDRRLNTKIDKTQLTTVLDEAVTDEQIPSARIVVDKLGLKANDSEVVKKMVTKVSQNVDDLVDEGHYYVIEARNAPEGYGWIDVLANTNYTIQLFYPSLTTNCEMYIRRRRNGGAWESWQKVCTTKVENTDVVVKSISNDEISSGTMQYKVINGICHLSLLNVRFSTTAIVLKMLPDDTVPRCAINECWGVISDISGSTNNALIRVSQEGCLGHYILNDITKAYSGYFSYPVAE